MSLSLAAVTALPAQAISAAADLLSQGKPVTASSVENATTPAAAAVDGNATTRWASAFSDPQWLQVDLGLHLWEVAVLAPRGLGLRDVAMPYLEDLFAATRQHVQLAVLDGLDVVYIERISSREAIHVHSRVGGRWPAHATGVGLVLLAYAPQTAQEQALAGPLAAFTSKTIVDPDALRRTLAEVGRTGYALSDRQVTLDAVSVAAPIRDAAGDVVAALSVVVRAGARLPGTVPAVLAAARGISLQLLRNPQRRSPDGCRQRPGAAK
ncbi:IclR family transcriptional regulator C-terminal domain-containing protein [Nonomuraea sp. NPDC046802]|uniref:IclR family transcriptional regulator domain-containing protein n=1 Tax=Nonomuraea sp. NPDC046802 TaxID=3154919 RepID=UPI0034064C3B